MPTASFRSHIAGVVSDTLYVPLKQFLAPEGQATKPFCFILCCRFLFVLKRKRQNGGGEAL